MRKYNVIMAVVFIIYIAMAVVLYFFFQDKGMGENLAYKVEINEVMQGLEKAGGFSEPDLRGKEYLKDVSFLSAWAEAEEIRAFYQNHNGTNMTVVSFFAGEELLGYVRFDYVAAAENDSRLWLAEGFLFAAWVLAAAVLIYIRQRVLKPFNALSNIPYELSKGHLSVEPLESKNRFFGKFMWGIAMLRDDLRAARNKTLKLEKEKKLLLLSISHDIKIPLSAIKLYTKALKEGIYEDDEQKLNAVRQIENKAYEIEEFVKQIVSTASEDVFTADVADLEFYLEDYINKVQECYEPRCRLMMIDLIVGKYENKLLKGDIDCAFEVMENLMENAFKYGDGRQISIDFYEEDYCQIIQVTNTGGVVLENEMPHLFDSFFRGSNAADKDGNGLGLYINRQLMLKMEGDIFAKRNEGGMSFYMVYVMAS